MHLLVLYVHLVSTIFMTGLIWFVQIVHYPLFQNVGRDVFTEYEAMHQRLTSYVVGPVMLLEATTAGYLVVFKSVQIQSELLWVGMFLVILNWVVTALISMPQHRKLSDCFDQKALTLLVRSNWIRTIAWSLRSGVASVILYQFLS